MDKTPNTTRQTVARPQHISKMLGVALMLALLQSPPSFGGLVDFSGGLINAVSSRFGKSATTKLYDWQRTLRGTPRFDGNSQTEMQLLRRVNDFFNRVPYETDQDHWGMIDYWATPVEMLASNGGDCEDYAIAKYLSLKELGVPVEKLRIAYVKALRLNENHMVLAYYPSPEADPLILDNLNKEIRPASTRSDLAPVFSFNEDDLWMPNGGGTRKGGGTSVRRWKELLDKLAREQSL